nr:hypothetical protein [Streptomyces avicenniae]
MLRARTTPPRPLDVTAVVPELAPLARTATRLHPRPGVPSPHDSSIGGPLLWPADEPWPHCEGPHVWDGVNDPVALRDERLRRRGLSAAAGGAHETADTSLHTPDKHAFGKRADARPAWPEGPVPLLPVAQLYVRDVPGLRVPGGSGADVLQVLSCPFDHSEPPGTALFWRSAATVTDILAAPPEPPVIQFPGYLPEPCLLAPERTTEYPSLAELGKESRRRLEDRSTWRTVGGAVVGSDPPWSKGFYVDLYTGTLSVAPGWKVGGWTRWALTDPQPRLCAACGTEMDALLTLASREWSSGTESWIPEEDRAESLASLTEPPARNPAMLDLARGYDLQLYACPVSPDHPHLELIQ